VTPLKDGLKFEAGDIVDGTFMSRSALTDFLAQQVADARETGVLFSLHMKATMMKVSDPIIFGHAVRAYFRPVFEKHAETLAKLGTTELLLCGMMTQNCVTHTAISKAAEKYNVCILVDCCTTVSEILHLLALHAVSTRVKLVPSSQVL
jgi:isocitrate dehydrogenase